MAAKKKPQKKTPAPQQPPARKKPTKPKSLVTAEKRLTTATAKTGNLKKELSNQRAKATATKTKTNERNKVQTIHKKTPASKKTPAPQQPAKPKSLVTAEKRIAEIEKKQAEAKERVKTVSYTHLTLPTKRIV